VILFRCRTLADYGIGSQATLDLSLRGLGGGPKEASEKDLGNPPLDQPTIGQIFFRHLKIVYN
jgi:hypothetical protein